MRRGEIWQVDLDPARGNEADKTRPVVIVSNDARNRQSERSGRGVVTVVPLTSNTKQVLPFQVLVAVEPWSGLEVASKAQAEQVRSVAVERLITRRGRLSTETLAALDAALMLHLDLHD